MEKSNCSNAFVVWRHESGVESRVPLSRLSRDRIVFDLAEPVCSLRTSQVIEDVQVICGDRQAYAGRAVVAQLIDLGTHTVCQLALAEPGLSRSAIAPTEDGQSAPAGFAEFFEDWQQECRIDPEFRQVVWGVRSFLSGLCRWMERVEMKWASDPNPPSAERQDEFLTELMPSVLAAFNIQHRRFEELAYRIPVEARAICQEFVRQHWLPLFLCSPIGDRTFRKPLGYAGDYEMMNMIHRNEPEGVTLFARAMHLLLLSQWSGVSVRNRVVHLKDNLVTETLRVVNLRRRARFLNIGCGPAREAQYFLRDYPLADHADFTMLDFDDETLTYTGGVLNSLCREHGRRSEITMLKMSVRQLLKRCVQNSTPLTGQPYDVIYCAGLFDYLSDATIRSLVQLLYRNVSPGGTLVVANMDDCQPFRNFIEFVLDWYLIFRTGPQMAGFAPVGAEDYARVAADPTGCNVFLHLRKPG